MSTCPAVTRSPRSARIRLTLPSASDEIVTWSTATSVPTTSTARRTESCRTISTCTGLAAASRLLAWAVSGFEHPVVARAKGRRGGDKGRVTHEVSAHRVGGREPDPNHCRSSEYTIACLSSRPAGM